MLPMSELLYIDSAIVVVSKYPGEAVESRKTNTRTVVAEWREQIGDDRLQPLHRIDQPVGGIVVLGRGSDVLTEVYRQFREGLVTRTYLAIVVEAPSPASGTLKHHLSYDEKRNTTYIDESGKRAILHYATRGSTDHHTILEVTLETGRHHQIRAQLAAIGSTILGDAKYGARRPMRDKSIGLHAWKLTLTHPVSGLKMPFTAPLPSRSVWSAVERVIYPSSQCESR
jgi:23S rRNA pseudouridine1911/1915/1917 synthase